MKLFTLRKRLSIDASREFSSLVANIGPVGQTDRFAICCQSHKCSYGNPRLYARPKTLLKAPCFLSDKMESNIAPDQDVVQKKTVIIQIGDEERCLPFRKFMEFFGCYVFWAIEFVRFYIYRVCSALENVSASIHRNVEGEVGV
ncbi:hypothetical protein AVEN_70597-1 [Araneus ventricosus]|uniref:Uncharacterized protein n=1 Tax=Araneus ventricosus TaxID=182803 RepID=A0A4Y2CHC9_ARAVE|nr:hypothetical protein AVEN_70597-1 [Araneus ventricosus]